MHEETITADSWDHAEITYLRHWSYPVALIQGNHSSFLNQAQLLFFSRHDYPKGKSTVIVEIAKEKWSFQKQLSWLPYKGKECWAKTSIITIMDFICAETNYRSNEEIGQPLSFLDRHQDVGTEKANTEQKTRLSKTPTAKMHYTDHSTHSIRNMQGRVAILCDLAQYQYTRRHVTRDAIFPQFLKTTQHGCRQQRH